MLTQTLRALTDDERYLLLAQRNRATDAGGRSRTYRVVETACGTAAGVGVGLLLAAGLRAAGLGETYCRLAALIVATAWSILSYSIAEQRQRLTLERAIREATEIDRMIADGVAQVREVRAARVATIADDDECPEDTGWLFDLGGDGTLFVRADADSVPDTFPVDAFRFAVGDGRGAIDEEIEPFGAPLAPTAHVVYTDLWQLGDRSLYAVPFDAALADPSRLAAAP